MTEKTYDVTVPVTVRVTVADEPVGDWDPQHPLDPRRMEGIYDLEDPSEMLTHLAYNAIMNHKQTASGLDGWGDISVLTDEHTDWERWRREAHVRDHHPVQMRVVDVDTGFADFYDEQPPATADVQASS